MMSSKSAILASLIAMNATFASISPAGAAPAAPTAEQMARCAAIQGRDTRLSCYDSLAHRPPDEAPAVANNAPAPAPAPPAAAMRAAASSGTATPAAATAPEPVSSAPTTVAAVAADPKNFGLSATQTHIADLGPKAESAHISILSSDQTGQTFAVLDNGQTWVVTGPDGWLNSGDAVTIKRAQFGSYLMFVPSHHSYHVRRLK
jgi:hypothetical protein